MPLASQLRPVARLFAAAPEVLLLALQRVLGVLLDQLGDQAGPPGLVAGAEAGAGVAIEIFVEQDEVAPVRIGLELLAIAVDRPAALRCLRKRAQA